MRGAKLHGHAGLEFKWKHSKSGERHRVPSLDLDVRSHFAVNLRPVFTEILATAQNKSNIRPP